MIRRFFVDVISFVFINDFPFDSWSSDFLFIFFVSFFWFVTDIPRNKSQMEFDYYYINALESLLDVRAGAREWVCVFDVSLCDDEQAHLYFTLDLDRYLCMHTTTSLLLLQWLYSWIIISCLYVQLYFITIICPSAGYTISLLHSAHAGSLSLFAPFKLSAGLVVVCYPLLEMSSMCLCSVCDVRSIHALCQIYLHFFLFWPTQK